MSDLRSRIKATDDRRTEIVDVPEWGVKIGIRSLSARDRIRLFRDAQDDSGRVRQDVLMPALLAVAAFDPDNPDVRLFDDDDADWLAEKDFTVIDRLAAAVITAAGLDDDEADVVPPSSGSIRTSTQR